MNKDGNLIDVLAGVIRGVLDGEIEPQQANAINGTVSQIIKIAKLKIQHNQTSLDSVMIPPNNRITAAISSEEKLRKQVFAHIATHGDGSFKDIGESLGLRWETIENVARHDSFVITGNLVSIRT